METLRKTSTAINRGAATSTLIIGKTGAPSKDLKATRLMFWWQRLRSISENGLDCFFGYKKVFSLVWFVPIDGDSNS